MDAFEPFRKAAARLHDKLVAAGVDPQRPVDLVRQPFEILSLNLPCFHSAIRLSRVLGRSLTSRAGPSVVKIQEEPGERVLLIAHEIGHAGHPYHFVRLHTDDIDP